MQLAWQDTQHTEIREAGCDAVHHAVTACPPIPMPMPIYVCHVPGQSAGHPSTLNPCVTHQAGNMRGAQLQPSRIFILMWAAQELLCVSI